MAIDIITHGSGEGLIYCLNAVASFFNGGSRSVIASLMIFTSLLAFSKMAMDMVFQQSLEVPMRWMLTYIIVLSSLTIPKIDVIIRDRVTSQAEPVKNVPLLLGLTAGLMSQIGDVMAEKTDQFFQQPIRANSPSRGRNVMQYKKHGVAMASKLIANASHFTFTDHDMANNMREFVKECVVFDIALGKYTIESLKHSKDLWATISNKASPNGGVIFRKTNADGSANTEFLSCQMAARKIDSDWQQVLRQTKKIYGNRLYPYSKNPSQLLETNLVDAYGYMTNLAMNADSIMRQNIMRNALEDGMLGKAIESDASGAIQSMAIARAEAMQEAAYALQGGMAAKAVAILRIIIELTFYGIFPLVAIVAIMPGCIGILKTYALGILWIQSWAPLYSIINMIANVYGKYDAAAAVTTAGGTAVSAATIPLLGEASTTVAKYAGYAMMSVPFLSWGLLKYGGGALAQMSAHFGSVTQSAASSAAHESVTGNISQGVTNFDNHSRHNTSGFKHDTNSLVSMGRVSAQLGDGSMHHINRDGSNMLDRSAAISRLGVSLNDRGELASSFSNLSQDSISAANNSLSEYQSSVSDALNEFHNYQTNRSNNLSSDTNYGSDLSFGVSQSFQDMSDVVSQYSEKYGVARKTAINSLGAITCGMNVSFKTGTPLESLIGTGLSGNANLGLEGRFTYSIDNIKDKNEISSDQMQMAEKFANSMDSLNKAFKTESLREGSLQANSWTQGMNDSLSRALSSREAMTSSLTDATSYQEAANLVETKGVGFSSDLSQDFLNWASEQKNQFGQSMGVFGIENALQDSNMRQDLINDYIKSHSEEVLQHFSGHKSFDNQIIRNEHNEHLNQFPNKLDVLEQNKLNSNILEHHASSNDLDKNIDLQAKEKVEQKVKYHEEQFAAKTKGFLGKQEYFNDAQNKLLSNHKYANSDKK